MTGKGERKLREWASRRDGDPLCNHDIVELVFALDEDNEARHAETMLTLSDHLVESTERDRRISRLEESQRACPGRVRELVQPLIDELESDHEEFHLLHMSTDHRATDPEDADFTERRGKRYTREQVVIGIIMALSVIVANAGVTWLVIRALEAAAQ